MILQLHDYADLARPFIREMDTACVEAGYSQHKLFVQICAESAWNPNATSDTGAIGLCQIEPDTAHDWNCDPSDPVSAMGAMAHNMKMYEDQLGSYQNALAAYNAGEGAVAHFHGVPPYAETEEYVDTIYGTYQASAKFWPAFYAELLLSAPPVEDRPPTGIGTMTVSKNEPVIAAHTPTTHGVFQ